MELYYTDIKERARNGREPNQPSNQLSDQQFLNVEEGRNLSLAERLLNSLSLSLTIRLHYCVAITLLSSP